MLSMQAEQSLGHYYITVWDPSLKQIHTSPQTGYDCRRGSSTARSLMHVSWIWIVMLRMSNLWRFNYMYGAFTDVCRLLLGPMRITCIFIPRYA